MLRVQSDQSLFSLIMTFSSLLFYFCKTWFRNTILEVFIRHQITINTFWGYLLEWSVCANISGVDYVRACM